MSLELQGQSVPQGSYQAIPEKLDDNVLFLKEGLEARAKCNFIKKVYAILSVQLLLTVGVCCISYFVLPYLIWQIENQWMMIILTILMIIVEVVIFCVPVGRKFPVNMILLFIFTLCEAYVIGYVCAIVAYQNDQPVVIVAAAMTLAITIGLTLYAMFSTSGFLIKFGIIIVIGSVMFVLGIVLIFTDSVVVYNIYCSLAVIVFGIYLVIDTQFIVGNLQGGGMRIQLSMDDYVIGALILYMDIIQIFLYILMLLSKKK